MPTNNTNTTINAWGDAIHSVADIFPLMDGEAFDELKADIARNGLRQPIPRHQGAVVDGRNRLRACRELGIDPDFVEWDRKGTLVSYVLSLNLRRRHLNESQRAVIAAKIANMSQGRPTIKGPIGPFNSEAPVEAKGDEPTSVAEAAEQLNVGERSVKRAKKVLTTGTKELVDAVEKGDVSVAAAAKLADEKPAKQRALVKAGSKAMTKAANKDDDVKPAEASRDPLDQFDTPIPDRPGLREAIANAAKFDEIMGLLKKVRAGLTEIMGDADPAKSRPPIPGGEQLAEYRQQIDDCYEKIYYPLKHSRPHSVCVYCKGKGCRPNTGCRGLGWDNRMAHRDAPSEMLPAKARKEGK